MSSGRNFSNFHVGDNPYRLGSGAVRELAHASGVDISTSPSREEIQQLFDAWGTDARYQFNGPEARSRLKDAREPISIKHLGRLLHRTGILSETFRPIVDNGDIGPAGFQHALLFEGTPGWMDKRAARLQSYKREIGQVVLAATDRQFSQPAELVHPEVVALRKRLDRNGERMPTAAEYMRHVIAPRLLYEGFRVREVVEIPYQQPDPSANEGVRKTTAADLMRGVLGTYPQVEEGLILKAENAPAGGLFADPFLTYMHEAEFPHPSQFYITAAPVELAQTQSQIEHPSRYQNPYTAMSSLARWVRAVHEVNEDDVVQRFAD